jgi:colicin import membrane protein
MTDEQEQTRARKELADYANAAPSALQARFADWLLTIDGVKPADEASFREGVRLATALRMQYQRSDENRTASQAAKEQREKLVAERKASGRTALSPEERAKKAEEKAVAATARAEAAKEKARQLAEKAEAKAAALRAKAEGKSASEAPAVAPKAAKAAAAPKGRKPKAEAALASAGNGGGIDNPW